MNLCDDCNIVFEGKRRECPLCEANKEIEELKIELENKENK